jgi:iron-sulfur cluster assembly 1
MLQDNRGCTGGRLIGFSWPRPGARVLHNRPALIGYCSRSRPTCDDIFKANISRRFAASRISPLQLTMASKASISIYRLTRPSPSSTALRLVSQSAGLRQTGRQTCPHCLRMYRTFSSESRLKSSSKRLLMTETVGAHRTDSLHPGPPPPRNTGVPETSIAGALETDSSPKWALHTTTTFPKSTKPESRESQAQQPAVSPQPAPAKPRSRLRARKAPMTLTPTAVEHVRELLNSPEPKLIRVGVKNKGCSGSAYHLEYVDSPGKFDELVEQDGVKVLIDSKALIKVIGSEMDWVEDKLSARFTFTNPNISKYSLKLKSN